MNALEIARGLWEITHATTDQTSELGRAIPTLAELQTKLDSVRREVRNLTVMGMDPNQTTEQAALHQRARAFGESRATSPQDGR